MPVFLVEREGWGVRFWLVRADSEAHALELTGCEPERARILRVSESCVAGIVWEYDYSPDSRP